MIRWCCYCQAFLGEVPPFDSVGLTHGICKLCTARLGADENLHDTTAEARDLMNRIFDCASRADAAAIPALLEEAKARGLATSSVLVGLLQPVLYRAGDAWRQGSMSIAAEHALTLWCECFFAQLPVQAPAKSSLDLIIFSVPENDHSIGPRFAGELLNERGITTRVVVPTLPIEDMVAEVERLRPRAVGLSCAVEESLASADAVCVELAKRIDPSWPHCFLLGGFALRISPTWVSSSGATVIRSLDDVDVRLRTVPRWRGMLVGSGG